MRILNRAGSEHHFITLKVDNLSINLGIFDNVELCKLATNLLGDALDLFSDAGYSTKDILEKIRGFGFEEESDS